MKAAREELMALVEEAKTKKLSPDSKLKEKLQNTLKTAEAALNGQSLDEMNVAIGDLKRVLDEVKQEEKILHLQVIKRILRLHLTQVFLHHMNQKYRNHMNQKLRNHGLKKGTNFHEIDTGLILLQKIPRQCKL